MDHCGSFRSVVFHEVLAFRRVAYGSWTTSERGVEKIHDVWVLWYLVLVKHEVVVVFPFDEIKERLPPQVLESLAGGASAAFHRHGFSFQAFHVPLAFVCEIPFHKKRQVFIVRVSFGMPLSPGRYVSFQYVYCFHNEFLVVQEQVSAYWLVVVGNLRGGIGGVFPLFDELFYFLCIPHPSLRKKLSVTLLV